MKIFESMISRRKFLNGLFGGSVLALVGTLAGPIIRFCFPGVIGPEPDEVLLSPEEMPQLAPNQGAIFRYGNRPGLLFKTPDGELRAFNATCTHFECTVQYNTEQKNIYCACHKGYFDLDGKVTAGPPPTPLIRYVLEEQEDGGLLVMKPEWAKEKREAAAAELR